MRNLGALPHVFLGHPLFFAEFSALQPRINLLYRWSLRPQLKCPSNHATRLLILPNSFQSQRAFTKHVNKPAVISGKNINLFLIKCQRPLKLRPHSNALRGVGMATS